MPKYLQTTEEAIQTVKENNSEYYELAIELAEKWVAECFIPFTSEDLSAYLYLILGLPKEKRVLGAIVAHLKKEKLIKHTGRYTKYKAKQGHGKPTSVWLSIKYSESQGKKRLTDETIRSRELEKKQVKLELK